MVRICPASVCAWICACWAALLAHQWSITCPNPRLWLDAGNHSARQCVRGNTQLHPAQWVNPTSLVYFGKVSEGTRKGLEAARARGRKPKLSQRQVLVARRMYEDKGEDGKRKCTVAEIAETFGVSRKTIYRHLD